MALSNTQPNGIKQVIRGKVSVTAGIASATANISAVDMTKSELRFLGAKGTAGGWLELTNSTTVTMNRISTAGVDEFSFEVTERW